MSVVQEIVMQDYLDRIHERDVEILRLKGELEHVKFLCGPDESGKNVFERENALKGELAEAIGVLGEIASSASPPLVSGAGPAFRIAMNAGASARAFLQKHEKGAS